MVAARKLDQKEHIILETTYLLQQSTAPVVSTASSWDIDKLEAADRAVGIKPFYVTLGLGHRGQKSLNNRHYVDDVAINAIYSAIINDKVGGIIGHTPESERSTHFKPFDFYWVGAHIDQQSGIVWGKKYIPQANATEEQKHLIQYYEIMDAGGARVGTSIEGMGFQEWDSEAEMWNITALDVERIDAVGAKGTGIPFAGITPWRISSEKQTNVQENTPDEVALPESNQSNEPALSEGQADNDSNVSIVEGEIPMADKPATPTAEERIAELQKSQEKQLTELQAQLQEAQTKARNAEATLINLRKAIGVAENLTGEGAVEAAKALVTERDGLKTENAALLETAIERVVEEKAKIIGEALQSESEDVKAFAQTVRDMIRTQVQAENIGKKADIESKVLSVIEAANIQSMLKALRVAAMGPNVTVPTGKADKTENEMEAVTY